METLFNILIWIFSIGTFAFGCVLIFEIEEIAIGKVTSQLIALIFAIVAFYRIDAIPFIGQLDSLVIDTWWLNILIKAIFVILLLILIVKMINQWRDEIKKIKDDVKIIYIVVLFGVSNFGFSQVA